MKKAGFVPAFFKIIKQPSFYIQQRKLCRLLHIPGNVCYVYVAHIRCHMLRKGLHIACRVLLLCRFPNSSVVPMHSKALHIPCLTEYISPSSLHLLPVCRMMRNDYILLHILNMLQYNFCTCDNLS